MAWGDDKCYELGASWGSAMITSAGKEWYMSLGCLMPRLALMQAPGGPGQPVTWPEGQGAV